MREIEIWFSPCPNDTFMFYAMVHGRINTEQLQFIPKFADIENLNTAAIKTLPEVSKVSFITAGKILNDYNIFCAGAALGNGCGPLLIGKKKFNSAELQNCSVAIPGKNTTAFYLLQKFFPQLQIFKEVLFSDIEDAVLNDICDLGLIIHENRFTYEQRGLIKHADLGELWESTTGFPIPLGGIVGKKSLEKELLQSINRCIQRSVAYAFDHYEETLPFVKAHSQDMNEKIIQQHIQLYVNRFSVDLGVEGKAAVNFFLQQTNLEIFV